MNDLQHTLTCLNMLDVPSDYERWLSVGMALYNEGASLSDWDNWSKRGNNYKSGECERRWSGFSNNGSGRSISTITGLLKESGKKPPLSPEYKANGNGFEHKLPSGASFDFDKGVITTCENLHFIESGKVKTKHLPKCPDNWDQAADTLKQIKTLFKSKDTIGYCLSYWKNESGAWVPSDGIYSKTVRDIVKAMKDVNNDDPRFSWMGCPKIDVALGTPHEIQGGMLRVNNLNGHGEKNENVVDFRYCLVECDEISIDMQYSLMLELKLPIATLVHSGKKSLHAIVRVDADDRNEYKERVRYIYKVCEENGLHVDNSCKNESRYSRLAGVYRDISDNPEIKDLKPQYLIGTNLGLKSFDDWYDYIEDQNDDLPEFTQLPANENDRPELSPELISDTLRVGHKMMLSGPSKAGKSFLLIELAMAIATGTKWAGKQCQKGKVLICNFEIDQASWENRALDIVSKLGLDYSEVRKNFVVWHLRGKNVKLTRLVAKMLRRINPEEFAAIIYDPIYKIMEGDENSAESISTFTNKLDEVSETLKASVIYCHHHSKGSQSGKRSHDRGSGSGVFARDADALVDVIELEVTDGSREQLRNYIGCERLVNLCKENDIDLMEIPEDETLVFEKFSHTLGVKIGMNDLLADALHKIRQEVYEICKTATAWRVGSTLREFASAKDRNIWFTYPIHIDDSTMGLLEGARTVDEAIEANSRGFGKNRGGKNNSGELTPEQKEKEIEKLKEKKRKKEEREAKKIEREQKKYDTKVSQLNKKRDKNIAVIEKEHEKETESAKKEYSKKLGKLERLNNAISNMPKDQIMCSVNDLSDKCQISRQMLYSWLDEFMILKQNGKVRFSDIQVAESKALRSLDVKRFEINQKKLKNIENAENELKNEMSQLVVPSVVTKKDNTDMEIKIIESGITKENFMSSF